MKKAILATKVGMTQIFQEDGALIPVTVLQAGPCVVTQVKTVENDGYKAVQVGFVDKKERVVKKDKGGKKEVAHRHGVSRAEMGHFKKAGVSGKRYVREFRFENAEEYELGKEIKADIFEVGDKIDASEKSALEADLNDLKALLESTKDVEMTEDQVAELKGKQEALMSKAQNLFTKMYENMQGAAGAAGPDMSNMGGAEQTQDAGAADDVVDGDYREV